MADASANLRERKPKAAEANDSSTDNVSTEPKKSSPADKVDDEDAYSPWVDILRVLTFLFVASCGLSYLISNGESFFWGMKNPPRYLQVAYWKDQFRGPIYLTPEELSAYDGSDESKPIYLAINGTIYDVSANRRTYGKGGSYNVFAGVDAARAYVTGCFADDRTPDMRGVEEMFLPIDDGGIDQHYSAEELKKMKKEEMAVAKQKVHDGLKHWVDFFAKSTKYHKVGYVKRPKNWLDKEPKRKLCEPAVKNRQKRKLPGQEHE